MQIRYTYIVRTWSHEDNRLVQRYACPFGVKDYAKKFMEDDRVPNNLPKGERMHCLWMTHSTVNNCTCSCIDDRDKDFETFYFVYCIFCIHTKLPLFWETYKQHLSDQPKTETLLDMWDKLWSKRRVLVEKSMATWLPPSKWVGWKRVSKQQMLCKEISWSLESVLCLRYGYCCNRKQQSSENLNRTLWDLRLIPLA